MSKYTLTKTDLTRLAEGAKWFAKAGISASQLADNLKRLDAANKMMNENYLSALHEFAAANIKPAKDAQQHTPPNP